MALPTFVLDEQGQDLIEYTLLVAFIVIVSAGLFQGMGDSVAGITTTSNNQLAAAGRAVGAAAADKITR